MNHPHSTLIKSIVQSPNTLELIQILADNENQRILPFEPSTPLDKIVWFGSGKLDLSENSVFLNVKLNNRCNLVRYPGCYKHTFCELMNPKFRFRITWKQIVSAFNSVCDIKLIEDLTNKRDIINLLHCVHYQANLIWFVFSESSQHIFLRIQNNSYQNAIESLSDYHHKNSLHHILIWTEPWNQNTKLIDVVLTTLFEPDTNQTDLSLYNDEGQSMGMDSLICNQGEIRIFFHSDCVKLKHPYFITENGAKTWIQDKIKMFP
jgi:hypothetical protein